MSIQAELELLKSQGELTPERVIFYARNEKTELHRCFLWDDTEAAHRYRLQQANAILRIHVVVRPTPKKDVRVSVKIEPGGKARIMPDIEPVDRDPFEDISRAWIQDGFLCVETINYPVRIPLSTVDLLTKQTMKTGVA